MPHTLVTMICQYLLFKTRDPEPNVCRRVAGLLSRTCLQLISCSSLAEIYMARDQSANTARPRQLKPLARGSKAGDQQRAEVSDRDLMHRHRPGRMKQDQLGRVRAFSQGDRTEVGCRAEDED